MGNIYNKEPPKPGPESARTPEEGGAWERDRRLSTRASRKYKDEDDKYSSRKKDSVRKEEVVISPTHRDLMVFCWENSKHSDLGNRIYMRVFEKRPDLQPMYDSVGREVWLAEGREFTKFLEALIGRLGTLEEVERLCSDFGRRHVDLRPHGFKPDFWVTMADAMTTECLYLDEGMHPPGEVIGAWASLISIMFSSMRDGYYSRLRRERRLSKKHSRQTLVSASSINSVRTSVDEAPDQDDMRPAPESLVEEPKAEDEQSAISNHCPPAPAADYFQ